MIKVERLSDGIEDEIDRISEGLSEEDFLRFESVLLGQFVSTQAAVHKITRSLMSSGKVSSKGDKNSWEGEISYGGSSTGIHNPVDYAEYERERGDAHDFLKPAKDTSNLYVAMMNQFLGG